MSFFGCASVPTFLIAASLSLATPAGAAEVKVSLLGADFGVEEAFIRAYVERRTGGRFDIPDEDVRIGRYDLNGDGQPELFVMLYGHGFCGLNACWSAVFQLRQGAWRQLGGIDVHDYYSDDQRFVRLADESRAGYRSLVSDDLIARWSGSEYVSDCRSRRCFDEEG